MNNNLNVLQQFEQSLKKCIIEYFSTNLNTNKTSKLNNTNYINEEKIKNLNSREEIQGFILRYILKDLINISYTDANNKTYGLDIENAVIEYYAKSISSTYKFDINNTSLDYEKTIVTLKNKFGDDFNNILLNNNIIQITSLLNTNIEKILLEYSSEDGKLQLIENNNEKYIKYINKNNEVIQNKLNINSKIELYFQDRLNNLTSEIKLSAEVFYNELIEIINNENGINQSNGPFNSETKDNQTNNLTPQQYEELCIKYANGENLTQEEMILLSNSSPELAESIINNQSNLTMNKSNTLGKITNSLLFYVIEIGVLFIILIILIINKN